MCLSFFILSSDAFEGGPNRADDGLVQFRAVLECIPCDPIANIIDRVDA